MRPATLKLATILQNGGEPEIRTQYNDPHELKGLGYNGLVLYETTALSGVDRSENIADPEMRQWVAGQFELVARRIDQARQAGLAVYVCYDLLSLMRWTVDREAAALTCKHGRGTLCPASKETIERCRVALEKLLSRLPTVDGVVIRFGDSDAVRLPYLVGNDIYQPRCARCRTMDAAQRICNVLSPICHLVIHQLGKRLIVRAWNVRPGGMHDSADLCRQVVERFDDCLVLSERESHQLVWSFKFTQTDFWRYQSWNEAVEQIASDRAVLQQLISDDNRSTIDPLVNTLLYAESLMASLRDLITGLVAYRQYRQTRDLEMGELCRRELLGAQSWWNHHTQRHGTLPGTATPFRQVHFWEFTERILNEVNQAQGVG